ncbi:hypothetical protein GAP31_090 [Cronobacter phage vB_CsaM_GAP31]|uniref:Uncharacterized protein n=1 Tax=Cronobacter phage vB_CsaM_GAP31 TaxID=1141135 RepID=K4FAV8_9CAUD|nr:hypothetical protein GAP31_090 [Cronobacter phage vB_CsaM_GAP31]AFC21269.1 hypothetical protein GAP31_090 [Cronobacter phage vB_CsaM_GAP31]
MKAHRWNTPKTKKMADTQYLYGVLGVIMCVVSFICVWLLILAAALS